MSRFASIYPPQPRGGLMMSVDPAIQRWLETTYEPEMGTGVSADERAAKAAEYSAYQLHQISEKLDRVVGLLDDISVFAATSD